MRIAVISFVLAAFFAPPVMALVAIEEPADKAAAVLDIEWQERSIGNADAPVTIIEYASMTCGHCAIFHEKVLPHIKAELIDTGKARLIYRDFPLNAGAVKAATLARCMPEQKFFPFLETVYKTQQKWSQEGDIDGALVKMAALAGLDAQKARACINHEALELKTVALMREGQVKYKINSTPSFVFYDQSGNQMQEYKAFTDLLEKHFEHNHKH